MLVYLFYFYAIVFETQEKMFKTSVNARPYCPLTSFFLENPSEYPPFSTTSLSFDAPFPGNFREYLNKSYTARNYSHWPTFSLVRVWDCLHWSFCGGLRKTHLFGNRVRIGRSGSSKVVDFDTNRKGVCDFLLVINSNFSPILHHFWDTATYWLKIANFSYPTLP